MFLKIISFLSIIILLFTSPVALPSKPAPIVESPENLSLHRNADEINGVNASKFFIERPKADVLTEVNASQFGLSESNYDNFDAFQSALDYCAANPRTKLVIDKGTYIFRDSRTLQLKNCSDLLIEGNDATFVFSFVHYQISVLNSDCVEIRNLNFEWNREESPLDSIVTIKNSSTKNNTIELVFRDKENCKEDVVLGALTECDPETFTFGAKNSSEEEYIYQNPDIVKKVEKISDNTLRVTHNGYLNRFKNGMTCILRHIVYGGSVFHLSEYSKNLTFDNVSVFGGAGMAFVGEGNANHFQIINSYIGVNPEYKDKYFVSLTADAIHIANSGGFINISNCDISKMGDDAINIHDGLGYVSDVNGDSVKLIAAAMRLRVGDALGFKNNKYETLNYTAKIVSVRHVEGITYEVVFDRDISGNIFSGYTAYSLECDSSNYVIRNNYFHENRARGLLLQSSNGLCENNRFYKIMGQAIKIIMDIIPTHWQEGTGVDNLLVQNNTFEDCEYSNWGAVIEIGTNIAGNKAKTTVFTNIEIKSNTFTGFPEKVLLADNVNNLIFSDNTIVNDNYFSFEKDYAEIHLGEYCSNITYKDNIITNDGFLGSKKIVRSDDIAVWAFVNSQL